MTVDLAIRVSFSADDDGLVSRIIDTLKTYRFKISRSSRRGIDARASLRDIEMLFDQKVVMEDGPHFNGPPQFHNLPSGLDYRVYFPRAPQLY
ncbi:hypothetical protein [Methylobacterium oryzisoli]|uniref:hypothetical protein n=1 Tax=Methylobacterium oryzisoli TaxID=3385502 RepID=UPI0038914A1A